MRCALDRSSEGEENEKRKHHISILPFGLLLICFFRLLESAIAVEAEETELLCTATNELDTLF